jgi:hypothetical protein
MTIALLLILFVGANLMRADIIDRAKYLPTNETILSSAHLPWLPIGTIDATAGDADDTLGVAERDFASAAALDNSVYVETLPGMNALEVRFVLTTNDEDVDIDVWACRGINEMRRVCTLDVICGLQNYTNATNHFAQTINISNETWRGGVSAISDDDDTMALFYIDDTLGYNRFLFHGWDTFDEDCIVEVSGY